ncbi:Ribonuclease Y [Candidatus Tiddalikarchaeum anstoanum]|nr:Ribonuclease Y [Candidatus Tiddalikarchaeum anstoanum]
MIPITREKALELIKKYNQDKSDMNHFLESEAIMGALAERLKEDVTYWRMLGLLHDVDWGITKNEAGKHLTKTRDILKREGFDDEFIDIIISHGYGFDLEGIKDRKREKKLEHALAAAETISGLIHAYALMRRGMADMKVSGLKEKFKNKSFAAKIDRKIILECESLGLSLDEFFAISIDAVKKVADEVGLKF